MNIVEHMPLVKQIAGKMHKRLPRSVDVQDMIQYGSIGLMDAARRFDSSRNNNFVAFARTAIWGAIVDGLRHDDQNTRRAHATGKARFSISAEGSNRHMGVPTEESELRRWEEDKKSSSPFDRVDRLDEIEHWRHRMSDREWGVVRMRYLEGRTLDVIAQHYGVTESAIHQTAQRLFDRLRPLAA